MKERAASKTIPSDIDYPDCDAVIHGRLNDLRELAHAGRVSLDDDHGKKRRLMGLAAEYGQTEILKFLISIGGNVNGYDVPQGWKTPLSYAVVNNHLPAILLLLANGAKPNGGTDFANGGFHPLHLAVFHNHPPLIPVLLKHGALPKFLLGNDLEHRQTPLSQAHALKHWECVLYLVAANAPYVTPPIVSMRGATIFQHASHAALIQDKPSIVGAMLKLEDPIEKMHFLEMIIGMRPSSLKTFMYTRRVGAPLKNGLDPLLYVVSEAYRELKSALEAAEQTGRSLTPL